MVSTALDRLSNAADRKNVCARLQVAREQKLKVADMIRSNDSAKALSGAAFQLTGGKCDLRRKERLPGGRPSRENPRFSGLIGLTC